MSWFDSIQGAVDAASSMDILNLDQMAVEQEHEQQAGGVDQSALEEAMYAEIERVNATLERERAKLLPESEQQQQQASDQLADLPIRIPPRSAKSTGSAGTAAAMQTPPIKLKTGKEKLDFFGLGLNSAAEGGNEENGVSRQDTNENHKNKHTPKAKVRSHAPTSFSVNEAVNVDGHMCVDSEEEEDEEEEDEDEEDDEEMWEEKARCDANTAAALDGGNYLREFDDSGTAGVGAGVGAGAGCNSDTGNTGSGAGRFGEYTPAFSPPAAQQQHSTAKSMLQAKLRGHAQTASGLMGSLLGGTAAAVRAVGDSRAGFVGFFDNDEDDDADTAVGTDGASGLLSDPILAQVRWNKERGLSNTEGYTGSGVGVSTPTPTPSKSQLGLQNLMTSIVPLSPMYSGLEEPGEGHNVNVNVAPETERDALQQEEERQQHAADFSSGENGKMLSVVLVVARGALDLFVAISATAIAVIQAVVLPLADALHINVSSGSTGSGSGMQQQPVGVGMDARDFYYQRAWKVATSKRGMIILGVMLLVLAWANVVSEGSFLDLA